MKKKETEKKNTSERKSRSGFKKERYSQLNNAF